MSNKSIRLQMRRLEGRVQAAIGNYLALQTERRREGHLVLRAL